MALLFSKNKVVFVHVPRTGGNWVKQSLRVAGVDFREIEVTNPDADGHRGIRQLPAKFKDHVAFSFVRHPIAWARSRWAHAMEYRMHTRGRFQGIHRLFDQCVCPTFQETIRTLVRERPGLVSTTFREMTDGCLFVGKTEWIRRDLRKALIECSLSPRRESDKRKVIQTIQSYPAVNFASQLEPWNTLGQIDLGLMTEFLHTEHWLLENFYPSTLDMLKELSAPDMVDQLKEAVSKKRKQGDMWERGE